MPIDVINAEGQVVSLPTFADVYNSTAQALRAQFTDASGTPLVFNNHEYETIDVSVTAQVLGNTGASGDYLSHLLVIPATTSPGLVTLLDGVVSIPVFVGGTSTLTPFVIRIEANSATGAWKVTTGANVSVIAFGDFT